MVFLGFYVNSKESKIRVGILQVGQGCSCVAIPATIYRSVQGAWARDCPKECFWSALGPKLESAVSQRVLLRVLFGVLEPQEGPRALNGTFWPRPSANPRGKAGPCLIYSA